MSTEATPHVFPDLGRMTTGPSPAEAAARRLGHAAGYASGLRSASAVVAQQMAEIRARHAAVVAEERQRTARAVAALAAAAARLDAREAGVVADAQDALAGSTLELTEAILGIELSDGETSARAALTRALAHVPGSAPRRVRLHPDDLALVVAGLDGAEVDVSRLELVADPDLAPGDAMTEFDDGWLDARVAAALERAWAALTGDER